MSDEPTVMYVIEGSDEKPKAKSLFSPLVQDFKPRVELVEFPSPELLCGSDENEREEAQWAFTTDGQLRNSSGAAWEVADEILRLQGDWKPPLSAPLVSTARPWSPSPLRPFTHSSAPHPQPYIDDEWNRRAYCAGKLGEPDDSFPFSAFSTWHQKGLMNNLPAPPVGFGHRRQRSGSQGSDSSFSSGASVSYMQVAKGVDGTPLDSPRAAFANFEAIQAIHSRRNSASSPHPAVEQVTPIARPAELAPVARATEAGHLIPRYEQQYLNAQLHAPRGIKSNARDIDALLHLANPTSCGSEMLIRLAMLQQGLLESEEGPSQWNRRISLYKTELCRGWQEKNSCKYGQKCQFAHGPSELRPSPKRTRQKTQPCHTFESTGACPFGKRCQYKHDTESSNSGGSSATHSRSSTPAVNGQAVEYLSAPRLPPSPALETQEELLQRRAASFSDTSSLSVNEAARFGGRLRAASDNVAARKAWDSMAPNTSGVDIRIEPPIARCNSPVAMSRIELLCATPAQPLPTPIPRMRSQGVLADLREDDEAPAWPAEFCRPSAVAQQAGIRCRSVSAQPVLSSSDSLWSPFEALGVSFDPAPGARKTSLGPWPSTAA